MKKEYYYIYCKGILGIKTNISDFKWIYGSVAPLASKDEYDKCLIKFDVCVKDEKQLTNSSFYDEKFQAYAWNEANKTIFYRRKFPLNLEIGYNLKICENKVVAEIGKNYIRFIKNRTMNLHGIYYLLSDVANILLLKNGFITLYASAVYYSPLMRGIVNFAPPNTGKSFTATRLCELKDYSLVSEDVIISNGQKIFSCPWTCSYRKGNCTADVTDSLTRVKRANEVNKCEECDITDLSVLFLGRKEIKTDTKNILKYISILNGYLFNYYSSPIVKILGYFDDSYYKPWNTYAEAILENMVKNSECRLLKAEKSEDFSTILHEAICGERI